VGSEAADFPRSRAKWWDAMANPAQVQPMSIGAIEPDA
jgi:hypothetical protein